MVEQLVIFRGKARNKTFRDKTLQENIDTRFHDIHSLNEYVMKQIHNTAFHNVFKSVPQNLHGIWLSYSSENRGRFDNYRLLTTTTSDYSKTLRKYIREKLTLITQIIRTDFSRYYNQFWGGNVNFLT